MTDDLHIETVGRDEASHLLSTSDCGDICLLISIGEWLDPLPHGFDKVRERMRLLFADSVHPMLGATEDDVRQIIDAARNLNGRTGRVVVHCQAGVSRSTAAALIMYAVALGPGREEEALRRVLDRRPIARPNVRMVEIADRLLGRDGALVRAVEEGLA